MFVSTFALLSSAFEHMLQPLAMLTLLSIIVFSLPKRARINRRTRAFLLGLGIVYAAQLVTGFLPPVWLSPLYTVLVAMALITLVCLSLWLAYRYARAQGVAMSDHVLRPITWLEQKQDKSTPAHWLLFSGGIIIALAEPLFYGYQQQLLTAELQTSISVQAIFLAFTYLAISLAPLVLTAWFAGLCLSYQEKIERLPEGIRAVLPLISSGALILLAWTLFLSAHSFI